MIQDALTPMIVHSFEFGSNLFQGLCCLNTYDMGFPSHVFITYNLPQIHAESHSPKHPIDQDQDMYVQWQDPIEPQWQ